MWSALQPGGGVELKSGTVTVPALGGELSYEHTYKYLELPEGAKFSALKTHGRRLLVRECYPEVFEQWWDRTGDDHLKDEGEILIGTPGVGKSMFLFYALYRLAQMERKVVFQSTDGMCTLFDGDTVVFGELARRETENPDSAYLIDASKKGDLKACCGPFLMASSPNKEVWKRVAEKEIYLQPYCAPVCSFGEMLALRELCFGTLSEGVVQELYTLGGGVARLLPKKQRNPSRDIASELRDQASGSDIGACRTALVSGTTKGGTESHALLHFFPRGTKGPRVIDVRFGSPYIERVFVDAMVKQGRQELVDFIAGAEALPAFPTLRGALYEGWAISELPKGGTFKCCELLEKGRGDEFDLEVPEAKENE